MYDLYYVKKRRRRRIAAIVSLIASIGVASLIVTSFLGRTTGSFTIKVANNDVKLSLSDTSDFKNPTSYLRIDQLMPLQEQQYGNIVNYVDYVDNEAFGYVNEYNIASEDADGNPDSLFYLKYTFFVKNSGVSTAEYQFSINFSDFTKSTDGSERTLDDTLRIMIYDTDINSGIAHAEPKVYAKNSPYKHYDINGNDTNREFISYIPKTFDKSEQENDTNRKLALSFGEKNPVISYSVPAFEPQAIRRYTVVIWLEGNDYESKPGEEPPQEASVRIGVNIDAKKV